MQISYAIDVDTRIQSYAVIFLEC